MQYFDALDARAGIFPGFAGVVVAVTPSAHLVTQLGRVVAVVVGLVGLWAFLPRKYPVTNLHALRRKYVGSDPRFTKLALLDARVTMIESTRKCFCKRASG